MVVTGYIETTLKELETLYNEHQSLKKDIYYSKLALLELCGWIEESFDSIVKASVVSKLKTDEYKKILKEIIKSNYGFQYSRNVRPMFIKAMGLQKTERIETRINKTGQVQVLSTTLGNLKKVRDDNAHTFIKGTTTIIQSPSITQSQYNLILPIIKKFDSEVRK